MYSFCSLWNDVLKINVLKLKFATEFQCWLTLLMTAVCSFIIVNVWSFHIFFFFYRTWPVMIQIPIVDMGWGYWVLHHFQQYFSYIVAVSFIDGGNQRKTTDLPQVTDKLYHIILYQVHLAWVGLSSQI